MLNHEEFFLQVLAYIYDNHEEWPKIKRVGVSSKGFPAYLQNIVQDFEEVAAKRSTLAAKMKIVGRFEKLPRPEKKLNLGQIAQRYHSASNFVKGQELGNAILKNPEIAEIIITEWKKNRSATVELLDFRLHVDKTVVKHEEKRALGKTVVEIPGFPLLSRMIGGFNPGRLILLTALTGVGKTNVALNLAIKAAQIFPVLYFNMEMMPEDIFERLIKSMGKITTTQWNDGSYIDLKKLDGVKDVYNGELHQPLLISSGKSQSIEEIVSTIVKKSDELKLGLVIIDYDQKIKTEESFKGEQWQQIHKAGEELEEIAKYCEVPIILLAQANELNNVRASQRIQQSASAQLHFYYDESDKKYRIEARKNRFGETGAKLIMNYRPDMSYCAEDKYDVVPRQDINKDQHGGISKSIFRGATD